VGETGSVAVGRKVETGGGKKGGIKRRESEVTGEKQQTRKKRRVAADRPGRETEHADVDVQQRAANREGDGETVARCVWGGNRKQVRVCLCLYL